MEPTPTYEDIKNELEAAIQQALKLPQEQGIEFAYLESLEQKWQHLSEEERSQLQQKLSQFALNEVADTLWLDSWSQH